MNKRIEGTSELMQQMTEKLGRYEEDYSPKVRFGRSRDIGGTHESGQN